MQLSTSTSVATEDEELIPTFRDYEDTTYDPSTETLEVSLGGVSPASRGPPRLPPRLCHLWRKVHKLPVGQLMGQPGRRLGFDLSVLSSVRKATVTKAAERSDTDRDALAEHVEWVI